MVNEVVFSKNETQPNIVVNKYTNYIVIIKKCQKMGREQHLVLITKTKKKAIEEGDTRCYENLGFGTGEDSGCKGPSF